MNKKQKWLLSIAAIIYFTVGFFAVSQNIGSIIWVIGFTFVAAVTCLVLYVVLGVPTIPNFQYREREKIIRRRITVVSYKPAVTFWDRNIQKILTKLFNAMNVEFEENKNDTKKTLKNPKDELHEQALRVVVRYNYVSTSLLQRRLSIGFARAARILGQLEEEGVVSEGEGGEPRIVLVKEVKTNKPKKLPN